MDSDRRSVVVGLVVNSAAIGTTFVVGWLGHLPPVSYGFGLLAGAASVILAILAHRASRRAGWHRADVVNSFSHFANGVVGVCLSAWLWTAFTGVVIATLGLALAVLSLLSIAAGFVTYPSRSGV